MRQIKNTYSRPSLWLRNITTRVAFSAKPEARCTVAPQFDPSTSSVRSRGIIHAPEDSCVIMALIWEIAAPIWRLIIENICQIDLFLGAYKSYGSQLLKLLVCSLLISHGVMLFHFFGVRRLLHVLMPVYNQKNIFKLTFAYSKFEWEKYVLSQVILNDLFHDFIRLGML